MFEEINERTRLNAAEASLVNFLPDGLFVKFGALTKTETFVFPGIDFTASNEWQGRTTFGGQSLHATHGNRVFNPYQRVIAILGETLEPFAGEKKLIPTYGFGDIRTQDHGIFPLKDDAVDGAPCRGIYEVLHFYNRVSKAVVLSGPTSFAPIIRKAIEIVRLKNDYHILVIIADGQMSVELPTIDAIVTASNFALSIVMVGVGDGPWEVMEEFDDQLPQRKFDNFQFVNFHQTTRKAKNPEASFALHALMEIPAQYKAIKSLGYLGNMDASESKSPGDIFRQNKT